MTIQGMDKLVQMSEWFGIGNIAEHSSARTHVDVERLSMIPGEVCRYSH